jgi:hypothetical protein
MSPSAKTLIGALVIIILILLGVIIYGLREKPTDVLTGTNETPTATTTPTTPSQNTPTTPTNTAPFATETTNRPCLIQAENFFEKKRAEDPNMYSGTWVAYYEKSSGMCFIQISNLNGVAVYSADNGYLYRFEGGVFMPLR